MWKKGRKMPRGSEIQGSYLYLDQSQVSTSPGTAVLGYGLHKVR